MAEKPSWFRQMVDRVVDQLKERLSLKTIGVEMLATVTDKIIPQGAAEASQAYFSGYAAYVPYGPSQGPAPLDNEQQANVHGPPAREEAQPSIESASPSPEIVRATSELQLAEQWFSEAAGSERLAYAARTPEQRELSLDRWQAMGQAIRESHQERGTVPPMWACMSREEMQTAFSPEGKHPAHGLPAQARQSTLFGPERAIVPQPPTRGRERGD